uniref:Uncharacterized protein n=1 Tax=Chromera velia CCMP2878 TaxID=1169474 RepID=A0A0G4I9W0_9ALVE|eukprot:Cvel_12367.t1-p1 / transcript=Cvel_12367.t1 / gene=Cvel_12367 / organism=Chromera_velia_CCMP2878 / gene_product=hypothetical protein / transcript_product=hypothetical protein / location=Cvel_scaffold806:32647-64339(-) / protein_length=7191 / sequence_SO=supercontig / SO=protein_coding / is_pseudo=false
MKILDLVEALKAPQDDATRHYYLSTLAQLCSQPKTHARLISDPTWFDAIKPSLRCEDLESRRFSALVLAAVSSGKQTHTSILRQHIFHEVAMLLLTNQDPQMQLFLLNFLGNLASSPAFWQLFADYKIVRLLEGQIEKSNEETIKCILFVFSNLTGDDFHRKLMLQVKIHRRIAPFLTVGREELSLLAMAVIRGLSQEIVAQEVFPRTNLVETLLALFENKPSGEMVDLILSTLTNISFHTPNAHLLFGPRAKHSERVAAMIDEALRVNTLEEADDVAYGACTIANLLEDRNLRGVLTEHQIFATLLEHRSSIDIPVRSHLARAMMNAALSEEIHGRLLQTDPIHHLLELAYLDTIATATRTTALIAVALLVSTHPEALQEAHVSTLCRMCCIRKRRPPPAPGSGAVPGGMKAGPSGNRRGSVEMAAGLKVSTAFAVEDGAGAGDASKAAPPLAVQRVAFVALAGGAKEKRVRSQIATYPTLESILYRLEKVGTEAQRLPIVLTEGGELEYALHKEVLDQQAATMQMVAQGLNQTLTLPGGASPSRSQMGGGSPMASELGSPGMSGRKGGQGQTPASGIEGGSAMSFFNLPQGGGQGSAAGDSNVPATATLERIAKSAVVVPQLDDDTERWMILEHGMQLLYFIALDEGSRKALHSLKMQSKILGKEELLKRMTITAASFTVDIARLLALEREKIGVPIRMDILEHRYVFNLFMYQSHLLQSFTVFLPRVAMFCSALTADPDCVEEFVQQQGVELICKVYHKSKENPENEGKPNFEIMVHCCLTLIACCKDENAREAVAEHNGLEMFVTLCDKWNILEVTRALEVPDLFGEGEGDAVGGGHKFPGNGSDEESVHMGELEDPTFAFLHKALGGSSRPPPKASSTTDRQPVISEPAQSMESPSPSPAAPAAEAEGGGKTSDEDAAESRSPRRARLRADTFPESRSREGSPAGRSRSREGSPSGRARSPTRSLSSREREGTPGSRGSSRQRQRNALRGFLLEGAESGAHEKQNGDSKAFGTSELKETAVSPEASEAGGDTRRKANEKKDRLNISISISKDPQGDPNAQQEDLAGDAVEEEQKQQKAPPKSTSRLVSAALKTLLLFLPEGSYREQIEKAGLVSVLGRLIVDGERTGLAMQSLEVAGVVQLALYTLKELLWFEHNRRSFLGLTSDEKDFSWDPEEIPFSHSPALSSLVTFLPPLKEKEAIKKARRRASLMMMTLQDRNEVGDFETPPDSEGGDFRRKPEAMSEVQIWMKEGIWRAALECVMHISGQQWYTTKRRLVELHVPHHLFNLYMLGQLQRDTGGLVIKTFAQLFFGHGHRQAHRVLPGGGEEKFLEAVGGVEIWEDDVLHEVDVVGMLLQVGRLVHLCSYPLALRLLSIGALLSLARHPVWRSKFLPHMSGLNRWGRAAIIAEAKRNQEEDMGREADMEVRINGAFCALWTELSLEADPQMLRALHRINAVSLLCFFLSHSLRIYPVSETLNQGDNSPGGPDESPTAGGGGESPTNNQDPNTDVEPRKPTIYKHGNLLNSSLALATLVNSQYAPEILSDLFNPPERIRLVIQILRSDCVKVSTVLGPSTLDLGFAGGTLGITSLQAVYLPTDDVRQLQETEGVDERFSFFHVPFDIKAITSLALEEPSAFLRRSLISIVSASLVVSINEVTREIHDIAHTEEMQVRRASTLAELEAHFGGENEEMHPHTRFNPDALDSVGLDGGGDTGWGLEPNIEEDLSPGTGTGSAFPRRNTMPPAQLDLLSIVPFEEVIYVCGLAVISKDPQCRLCAFVMIALLSQQSVGARERLAQTTLLLQNLLFAVQEFKNLPGPEGKPTGLALRLRHDDTDNRFYAAWKDEVDPGKRSIPKACQQSPFCARVTEAVKYTLVVSTLGNLWQTILRLQGEREERKSRGERIPLEEQVDFSSIIPRLLEDLKSDAMFDAYGRRRALLDNPIVPPVSSGGSPDLGPSKSPGLGPMKSPKSPKLGPLGAPLTLPLGSLGGRKTKAGGGEFSLATLEEGLTPGLNFRGADFRQAGFAKKKELVCAALEDAIYSSLTNLSHNMFSKRIFRAEEEAGSPDKDKWTGGWTLSAAVALQPPCHHLSLSTKGPSSIGFLTFSEIECLRVRERAHQILFSQKLHKAFNGMSRKQTEQLLKEWLESINKFIEHSAAKRNTLLLVDAIARLAFTEPEALDKGPWKLVPALLLCFRKHSYRVVARSIVHKAVARLLCNVFAGRRNDLAEVETLHLDFLLPFLSETGETNEVLQLRRYLLGMLANLATRSHLAPLVSSSGYLATLSPRLAFMHTGLELLESCRLSANLSSYESGQTAMFRNTLTLEYLANALAICNVNQGVDLLSGRRKTQGRKEEPEMVLQTEALAVAALHNLLTSPICPQSITHSNRLLLLLRGFVISHTNTLEKGDALLRTAATAVLSLGFYSVPAISAGLESILAISEASASSVASRKGPEETARAQQQHLEMESWIRWILSIGTQAYVLRTPLHLLDYQVPFFPEALQVGNESRNSAEQRVGSELLQRVIFALQLPEGQMEQDLLISDLLYALQSSVSAFKTTEALVRVFESALLLFLAETSALEWNNSRLPLSLLFVLHKIRRARVKANKNPVTAPSPSLAAAQVRVEGCLWVIFLRFLSCGSHHDEMIELLLEAPGFDSAVLSLFDASSPFMAVCLDEAATFFAHFLSQLESDRQELQELEDRQAPKKEKEKEEEKQDQKEDAGDRIPAEKRELLQDEFQTTEQNESRGSDTIPIQSRLERRTQASGGLVGERQTPLEPLDSEKPFSSIPRDRDSQRNSHETPLTLPANTTDEFPPGPSVDDPNETAMEKWNRLSRRLSFGAGSSGMTESKVNRRKSAIGLEGKKEKKTQQETSDDEPFFLSEFFSEREREKEERQARRALRRMSQDAITDPEGVKGGKSSKKKKLKKKQMRRSSAPGDLSPQAAPGEFDRQASMKAPSSDQAGGRRRSMERRGTWGEDESPTKRDSQDSRPRMKERASTVGFQLEPENLMALAEKRPSMRLEKTESAGSAGGSRNSFLKPILKTTQSEDESRPTSPSRGSRPSTPNSQSSREGRGDKKGSNRRPKSPSRGNSRPSSATSNNSRRPKSTLKQQSGGSRPSSASSNGSGGGKRGGKGKVAAKPRLTTGGAFDDHRRRKGQKGKKGKGKSRPASREKSPFESLRQVAQTLEQTVTPVPEVEILRAGLLPEEDDEPPEDEAEKQRNLERMQTLRGRIIFRGLVWLRWCQQGLLTKLRDELIRRQEADIKKQEEKEKTQQKANAMPNPFNFDGFAERILAPTAEDVYSSTAVSDLALAIRTCDSLSDSQQEKENPRNFTREQKIDSPFTIPTLTRTPLGAMLLLRVPWPPKPFEWLADFAAWEINKESGETERSLPAHEIIPFVVQRLQRWTSKQKRIEKEQWVSSVAHQKEQREREKGPHGEREEMLRAHTHGGAAEEIEGRAYALHHWPPRTIQTVDEGILDTIKLLNSLVVKELGTGRVDLMEVAREASQIVFLRTAGAEDLAAAVETLSVCTLSEKVARHFLEKTEIARDSGPLAALVRDSPQNFYLSTDEAKRFRLFLSTLLDRLSSTAHRETGIREAHSERSHVALMPLRGSKMGVLWTAADSGKVFDLITLLALQTSEPECCLFALRTLARLAVSDPQSLEKTGGSSQIDFWATVLSLLGLLNESVSVDEWHKNQELDRGDREALDRAPKRVTALYQALSPLSRWLSSESSEKDGAATQRQAEDQKPSAAPSVVQVEEKVKQAINKKGEEAGEPKEGTTARSNKKVNPRLLKERAFMLNLIELYCRILLFQALSNLPSLQNLIGGLVDFHKMASRLPQLIDEYLARQKSPVFLLHEDPIKLSGLFTGGHRHPKQVKEAAALYELGSTLYVASFGAFGKHSWEQKGKAEREKGEDLLVIRDPSASPTQHSPTADLLNEKGFHLDRPDNSLGLSMDAAARPHTWSTFRKKVEQLAPQERAAQKELEAMLPEFNQRVVGGLSQLLEGISEKLFSPVGEVAGSLSRKSTKNKFTSRQVSFAKSGALGKRFWFPSSTVHTEHWEDEEEDEGAEADDERGAGGRQEEEEPRHALEEEADEPVFPIPYEDNKEQQTAFPMPQNDDLQEKTDFSVPQEENPQEQAEDQLPPPSLLEEQPTFMPPEGEGTSSRGEKPSLKKQGSSAGTGTAGAFNQRTSSGKKRTPNSRPTSKKQKGGSGALKFVLEGMSAKEAVVAVKEENRQRSRGESPKKSVSIQDLDKSKEEPKKVEKEPKKKAEETSEKAEEKKEEPPKQAEEKKEEPPKKAEKKTEEPPKKAEEKKEEPPKKAEEEKKASEDKPKKEKKAPKTASSNESAAATAPKMDEDEKPIDSKTAAWFAPLNTPRPDSEQTPPPPSQKELESSAAVWGFVPPSSPEGSRDIPESSGTKLRDVDTSDRARRSTANSGEQMWGIGPIEAVGPAEGSVRDIQSPQQEREKDEGEKEEEGKVEEQKEEEGGAKEKEEADPQSLNLPLSGYGTVEEQEPEADTEGLEELQSPLAKKVQAIESSRSNSPSKRRRDFTKEHFWTFFGEMDDSRHVGSLWASQFPSTGFESQRRESGDQLDEDHRTHPAFGGWAGKASASAVYPDLVPSYSLAVADTVVIPLLTLLRGMSLFAFSDNPFSEFLASSPPCHILAGLCGSVLKIFRERYLTIAPVITPLPRGSLADLQMGEAEQRVVESVRKKLEVLMESQQAFSTILQYCMTLMTVLEAHRKPLPAPLNSTQKKPFSILTPQPPQAVDGENEEDIEELLFSYRYTDSGSRLRIPKEGKRAHLTIIGGILLPTWSLSPSHAAGRAPYEKTVLLEGRPLKALKPDDASLALAEVLEPHLWVPEIVLQFCEGTNETLSEAEKETGTDLAIRSVDLTRPGHLEFIQSLLRLAVRDPSKAHWIVFSVSALVEMQRDRLPPQTETAVAVAAVIVPSLLEVVSVRVGFACEREKERKGVELRRTSVDEGQKAQDASRTFTRRRSEDAQVAKDASVVVACIRLLCNLAALPDGRDMCVHLAEDLCCLLLNLSRVFESAGRTGFSKGLAGCILTTAGAMVSWLPEIPPPLPNQTFEEQKAARIGCGAAASSAVSLLTATLVLVCRNPASADPSFWLGGDGVSAQQIETAMARAHSREASMREFGRQLATGMRRSQAGQETSKLGELDAPWCSLLCVLIQRGFPFRSGYFERLLVSAATPWLQEKERTENQGEGEEEKGEEENGDTNNPSGMDWGLGRVEDIEGRDTGEKKQKSEEEVEKNRVRENAAACLQLLDSPRVPLRGETEKGVRLPAGDLLVKAEKKLRSVESGDEGLADLRYVAARAAFFREASLNLCRHKGAVQSLYALLGVGDLPSLESVRHGVALSDSLEAVHWYALLIAHSLSALCGQDTLRLPGFAEVICNAYEMWARTVRTLTGPLFRLQTKGEAELEEWELNDSAGLLHFAERAATMALLTLRNLTFALPSGDHEALRFFAEDPQVMVDMANDFAAVAELCVPQRALARRTSVTEGKGPSVPLLPHDVPLFLLALWTASVRLPASFCKRISSHKTLMEMLVAASTDGAQGPDALAGTGPEPNATKQLLPCQIVSAHVLAVKEREARGERAEQRATEHFIFIASASSLCAICSASTVAAFAVAEVIFAPPPSPNSTGQASAFSFDAVAPSCTAASRIVGGLAKLFSTELNSDGTVPKGGFLSLPWIRAGVQLCETICRLECLTVQFGSDLRSPTLLGAGLGGSPHASPRRGGGGRTVLLPFNDEDKLALRTIALVGTLSEHGDIRKAVLSAVDSSRLFVDLHFLHELAKRRQMVRCDANLFCRLVCKGFESNGMDVRGEGREQLREKLELLGVLVRCLEEGLLEDRNAARVARVFGRLASRGESRRTFVACLVLSRPLLCTSLVHSLSTRGVVTLEGERPAKKEHTFGKYLDSLDSGVPTIDCSRRQARDWRRLRIAATSCLRIFLFGALAPVSSLLNDAELTPLRRQRTEVLAAAMLDAGLAMLKQPEDLEVMEATSAVPSDAEVRQVVREGSGAAAVFLTDFCRTDKRHGRHFRDTLTRLALWETLSKCIARAFFSSTESGEGIGERTQILHLVAVIVQTEGRLKEEDVSWLSHVLALVFSERLCLSQNTEDDDAMSALNEDHGRKRVGRQKVRERSPSELRAAEEAYSINSPVINLPPHDGPTEPVFQYSFEELATISGLLAGLALHGTVTGTDDCFDLWPQALLRVIKEGRLIVLQDPGVINRYPRLWLSLEQNCVRTARALCRRSSVHPLLASSRDFLVALTNFASTGLEGSARTGHAMRIQTEWQMAIALAPARPVGAAWQTLHAFEALAALCCSEDCSVGAALLSRHSGALSEWLLGILPVLLEEDEHNAEGGEGEEAKSRGCRLNDEERRGCWGMWLQCVCGLGGMGSGLGFGLYPLMEFAPLLLLAASGLASVFALFPDFRGLPSSVRASLSAFLLGEMGGELGRRRPPFADSIQARIAGDELSAILVEAVKNRPAVPPHDDDTEDLQGGTAKTEPEDGEEEEEAPFVREDRKYGGAVQAAHCVRYLLDQLTVFFPFGKTSRAGAGEVTAFTPRDSGTVDRLRDRHLALLFLCAFHSPVESVRATAMKTLAVGLRVPSADDGWASGQPGGNSGKMPWAKAWLLHPEMELLLEEGLGLLPPKGKGALGGQQVVNEGPLVKALRATVEEGRRRDFLESLTAALQLVSSLCKVGGLRYALKLLRAVAPAALKTACDRQLPLAVRLSGAEAFVLLCTQRAGYSSKGGAEGSERETLGPPSGLPCAFSLCSPHPAVLRLLCEEDAEDLRESRSMRGLLSSFLSLSTPAWGESKKEDPGGTKEQEKEKERHQMEAEDAAVFAPLVNAWVSFFAGPAAGKSSWVGSQRSPGPQASFFFRILSAFRDSPLTGFLLMALKAFASRGVLGRREGATRNNSNSNDNFFGDVAESVEIQKYADNLWAIARRRVDSGWDSRVDAEAGGGGGRRSSNFNVRRTSKGPPSPLLMALLFRLCAPSISLRRSLDLFGILAEKVEEGGAGLESSSMGVERGGEEGGPSSFQTDVVDGETSRTWARKGQVAEIVAAARHLPTAMRTGVSPALSFLLQPVHRGAADEFSTNLDDFSVSASLSSSGGGFSSSSFSSSSSSSQFSGPPPPSPPFLIWMGALISQVAVRVSENEARERV